MLTIRYDDQQDYFDLNDTWNGRTASADAYKPVYIERSKVGREEEEEEWSDLIRRSNPFPFRLISLEDVL